MGRLGYAFLLSLASASAMAACPSIDVERVRLGHAFERLASAYVLRAGSAAPWILLVGDDAHVNADGASHSYEVNDHGVSYLCDGMCMRTVDGCVVDARCRQASGLLGQLPEENGKLVASCDGRFAPLGNIRIFGFSASPTLDDGFIDCTRTRIPVTGGEAGLRYLHPRTSLRLANGGAAPSETVPFVVLPRNWNAHMPASLHLELADVGWVVAPYADGALLSAAVAADIGPRNKFGEASIALHQQLVHGKLVEPPPYEHSPGRRHPQLASIPLPYLDTCDGDFRAKANARGAWWYLMSAGSATASLRQAADGAALVEAMDARLDERSEPYGGRDCLVERVQRLAPSALPSRPSERFGRTRGRCGGP